MESLKGPYGYRLIYPPLGNPIIPKAGRLGAGGLAPGLGENGTVYNHGAHGFLLRAAALAGRKSMINEILKYALPYDQDSHPVAKTKSEPYGIVNFYMETKRHSGEGGYPFLSGTISTLYRAFFENVIGIRQRISGLEIKPCIPLEWDQIEIATKIRNKEITLNMKDAGNIILLNGTPLTSQYIKYDDL